jgi:hypothetical protein
MAATVSHLVSQRVAAMHETRQDVFAHVGRDSQASAHGGYARVVVVAAAPSDQGFELFLQSGGLEGSELLPAASAASRSVARVIDL